MGIGWMYGVRQYGMHTLLQYLTKVAGVDRSIITDGFYTGTSLSPQEYLVSRVGDQTMRDYFADWAAHTAADMDYLTREQVERAYLEITLAGDWGTFRPSVWGGENEGTGGWVGAPTQLRVRGWAYNVYNITTGGLGTAAIYTAHLQGVALGSEGGEARFHGRLVVMEGDGGVRVQPMEMETGELTGVGSVSVLDSSQRVLLVVVSVPQTFGTSQTYDYQVKIDRTLQ